MYSQKGILIEAERADLVGEYIRHTAHKTRDLIKKGDGLDSLFLSKLIH